MLQDRRIKTSLFAITADLFLTLFKGGLAWLTGSAALLADALHSGTDLFVSLVLLGSLVLRYRQEQRPDHAPALGARRVESALAVLVSLLILYVPFEIVRGLDEHTEQSLQYLWVGIAGTLVIIGIVHFMSRLKTYVGQATDSPALEADGYHSKIDLFSSVAVLLSLLGMMVGIYLDEIAAVIIAVIIGIAGLELLVSGVHSLIKGDDLDNVSVADLLPAWLKPAAVIGAFTRSGRSLRTMWRRSRWIAIGTALALYFASGWSQVPHGFQGIHQRLGATVADGIAPGLHYHWPWPFGELQLVPDGVVYTASVGSRVLAETTAAGTDRARLWQDIKGTRVHDDETAYIATGDENLVAIDFTIQYRATNPSQLLMRMENLPNTVQRFAETALWQETAQHSFDAVMAHSHDAFADAVATRLRSQLAEAGVRITVVDAQVQSIQPPALVVPVYHDRLNAEQEKEQRINRAQAQSAHDLLLANAERITRAAEGQAELLERRLTAEGEAERFRQLAAAFGEHPNSVQFHQHQQTFVEALRDKNVLITDPRIDARDLRVWGPGELVTYPNGKQK